MDPSSFLRCAGGSRDATRGTLAALFFLVLGLSLFEEFVLGLAKSSRGVVEARDVGRSGQGGSIGQGGSVQGPGAVRMDASLHESRGIGALLRREIEWMRGMGCGKRTSGARRGHERGLLGPDLADREDNRGLVAVLVPNEVAVELGEQDDLGGEVGAIEGGHDQKVAQREALLRTVRAAPPCEGRVEPGDLDGPLVPVPSIAERLFQREYLAIQRGRVVGETMADVVLVQWIQLRKALEVEGSRVFGDDGGVPVALPSRRHLLTRKKPLEDSQRTGRRR